MRSELMRGKRAGSGGGCPGSAANLGGSVERPRAGGGSARAAPHPRAGCAAAEAPRGWPRPPQGHARVSHPPGSRGDTRGQRRQRAGTAGAAAPSPALLIYRRALREVH